VVKLVREVVRGVGQVDWTVTTALLTTQGRLGDIEMWFQLGKWRAKVAGGVLSVGICFF